MVLCIWQKRRRIIITIYHHLSRYRLSKGTQSKICWASYILFPARPAGSYRRFFQALRILAGVRFSYSLLQNNSQFPSSSVRFGAIVTSMLTFIRRYRSAHDNLRVWRIPSFLFFTEIIEDTFLFQCEVRFEELTAETLVPLTLSSHKTSLRAVLDGSKTTAKDVQYSQLCCWAGR